MLTEGTLTPALHRSVSLGRAMLPRTSIGVPAPSSSNLTWTPLPDFSSGLRTAEAACI